MDLALKQRLPSGNTIMNRHETTMPHTIPLYTHLRERFV